MSTWIPTWHQIYHISWSLWLFSKTIIESRPNTKLGDHATPNVHKCWFILFWSCMRTRMKEIHWNSIGLRAQSHMTSHYTWGPWPHYMILEVALDGLWTLSFGLSQFHGHGSWLVCEVALRAKVRGHRRITHPYGWSSHEEFRSVNIKNQS